MIIKLCVSKVQKLINENKVSLIHISHDIQFDLYLLNVSFAFIEEKLSKTKKVSLPPAKNPSTI